MEQVNGERYRAILQDPQRMEKVRGMVKGLLKGEITRPTLAEEYDLRAILYYHDGELRRVQWCITTESIFVWGLGGLNGDEAFEENRNLFREVAKRVFNL